MDPPYLEPPPPDEYPLTHEERRRWFVWFWVLLALGPAMVILILPLSRTLVALLPMALRPLLAYGVPVMIFCFPIVAAAGAAFCLGKARHARRTMSSFLAFVVLTWMGIVFVEWMLCAILWMLVLAVR